MSDILGFNNLTKVLRFNLYDFAVAFFARNLMPAVISGIHALYQLKIAEEKMLLIRREMDAISRLE